MNYSTQQLNNLSALAKDGDHKAIDELVRRVETESEQAQIGQGQADHLSELIDERRDAYNGLSLDIAELGVDLSIDADRMKRREIAERVDDAHERLKIMRFEIDKLDPIFE